MMKLPGPSVTVPPAPADRSQTIVVVMPAYNAERTLRATMRDIPKDWVDEIVLVDDASSDGTVELARELGIRVFVHERNRGYGGNQKTCYREALALGADIVVMVHPDHQYDPAVVPELVVPLLDGKADACFGSRMLGGRPLEGGMPQWKYFANILLTAAENLCFYMYLTEYHSGFRAYTRHYLESVALEANSEQFVFDTEIIAQGVIKGLRIREVPIVTRYFPGASQISFLPSVWYGLSILLVMARYKLHVWGWRSDPIFA